MGDVRDVLRKVKHRTNGMLPVRVYERIHQIASNAGGGTFIEIGTAQGAATIALALGAKAGGVSFHVYTADPFTGGSRARIGSVARNIDLVRSGFEAFGVADSITIVAGGSHDLLAAHSIHGANLLLIDADGRLDRDMLLLHDRLSPAAWVIVDDVDGAVAAHRERGGWVIDQKHRLSALLLTAFVEMDLLAPVDRIAQTGFYRKGAGVLRPEAAAAAALECYRELVFCRIGARQFGWARSLRGIVEARFPRALASWRRMRGRD